MNALAFNNPLRVLPVASDPHAFWVGNLNTLRVPFKGTRQECDAFVAAEQVEIDRTKAIYLACGGRVQETETRS